MGKFIFGFMKSMASRVKPAVPVLLVLLMGLITLMIWVFGPTLSFQGAQPLASIAARVAASLLFFVVCIATWGTYQWKMLNQFRAAEDKAQRLKADPFLAEEEKQDAELEQVMRTLSDNVSQAEPLYALPWYLMLGAEQSGKTSLVHRSEQNFVFSSVMKASSTPSEHRPYGIDWWMGEQAVLIDPSGELLTQGYRQTENGGQLERRLWMHFVQWLERTRRRRPLNGVIVTLDIAKLASDSASERKACATLLRARLRELMTTLNSRMPVYIALTKLDLLEGFEAFFHYYPKHQRDEALGFSFTLDSVTQSERWLDELTQDYDRFVAQLHAQLPRLLLAAKDSAERQKMYGFVRQLSGLKGALHEFLTELLGYDQFSTSALVRGVHFTSVYQQGVPVNVFENTTSYRYGLKPAVGRSQDATKSRVFFSSALFHHIIYPEAGLASDNRQVIRTQRRGLGLSFVTCGLASVLLLGQWQGYYTQNIQQAEAVLTKVDAFHQHFPEDVSDLGLQEMVTVLDTIREATLEVGPFRDKSRYLADMGLYQGHTLGPEVEATYLALLEERFLPLLLQDVVTKLSLARRDEDKLDLLRVFRMTVDKRGRDSAGVLAYFSEQWQQQYEKEPQFQARLAEHLEYALAQTDLASQAAQGKDFAVQILASMGPVIAQAQKTLSDTPIEQRVYHRLVTDSASYLGAPLNIKNQMGPAFDLVFEEREIDSEHLMLPALYTKDGVDQYFLKQVDALSELAMVDRWALGQTSELAFSAAQKRVLRQSIQTQYVDDYTTAWKDALNEVDVVYFLDLSHAIDVLDSFTGTAMPLRRLLTIVDHHTRLAGTLPEDKMAREALLSSFSYNVAASIQRPFSELDTLLDESNDQPAYIDDVQEALTQLLYYLKAIQDAPDRGRAALEAARSRLTLSAHADPIYQLQRMASGLPAPFDRMVKKIADESWSVLKQEAVMHLETRWQKEVFAEFKAKFADRYPFNAQAAQEVDLQDFETFFAPQGTLATFYQEQLALFIDHHERLREDDALHPFIRPEIVEQLAQAKHIGEAYFNRNGALDVSFTLEPLHLSRNKRRAVVNVDGQFIEYSHGPKRSVELIWPNALRAGAQSKVTLVPTQTNVSPRSVAESGAWSLFKLLERSDVIGGNASAMDYQVTLDGGKFAFRIQTPASNNVFKTELLHSFHLSDTLY